MPTKKKTYHTVTIDGVIYIKEDDIIELLEEIGFTLEHVKSVRRKKHERN